MKTLICGLILILLIISSEAYAASSFDGSWDATLSCPKADDGALGFSFEFPMTVKDGAVHGERGTKGQPGWMQLTGPIKEDGSAALEAEGITHISAYAIHHAEEGTHYIHDVTAQFSGGKGSGSWHAVRTCSFTFQKQ